MKKMMEMSVVLIGMMLLLSSPLCGADRCIKPVRSDPALSLRGIDDQVHLYIPPLTYMLGPQPGWPVDTIGYIRYSSPALGDIDDDGQLEVVISTVADLVYAFNADGNLYAWRGNGEPVPAWPMSAAGAIISSPAMGDIDNDGRVEVIVGSMDGKVYCWDMGPGSYGPDLLPWPMFQHDMRNTGVFPLPVIKR